MLHFEYLHEAHIIVLLTDEDTKMYRQSFFARSNVAKRLAGLSDLKTHTCHLYVKLIL